MRTFTYSLALLVAGILVLGAGPAWSANVKITPLGGQDGEFCRLDRAMIFEDPDGTRILYDAGRSVAGADDPRLGKIDVLLVSHMHGDHAGDKHTSGCSTSLVPTSMPTKSATCCAARTGRGVSASTP